jgi:hypothetical protein
MSLSSPFEMMIFLMAQTVAQVMMRAKRWCLPAIGSQSSLCRALLKKLQAGLLERAPCTLDGSDGLCNIQHFFGMLFWLDILENFLDDAIFAN